MNTVIVLILSDQECLYKRTKLIQNNNTQNKNNQNSSKINFKNEYPKVCELYYT